MSFGTSLPQVCNVSHHVTGHFNISFYSTLRIMTTGRVSACALRCALPGASELLGRIGVVTWVSLLITLRSVRSCVTT